MFETKVDIIHNLCKDDIMVEMCVSRLLPCDKGEERVDREQERLLEELYREMYSVLLCYANAALKDKALAEEAVQDTFRIACAKVGELSASENPRGWLMLTLKNVLRNTNRELAALNQLFVSAVSIDDEIVLETYASGTDYEKRKIRTCTWCLKTVSFSYSKEGAAMVCQDEANPGRTLPGMASKE